MRIIFDFDGTLVSVWKRYHQVFCDLVRGSKPDLATYRAMKLECGSDEALAVKLGCVLGEGYRDKKRILLEQKGYLGLDELLIEPEAFVGWFKANDCIILSKRRNSDNLYWEMRQLGLKEITEAAYALDPACGLSKADWLLAHRALFGSFDAIIGDSHEDMAAGDVLGIDTWFVETGLFATASITSKHEGCKVVSNVGDAIYLG